MGKAIGNGIGGGVLGLLGGALLAGIVLGVAALVARRRGGTAVKSPVCPDPAAGAVPLLLSLIRRAPAQASQTPAERAREIATALTKDPLYVDPAYASALPETLRADVRAKAKALGYPVYSIVLPLTPSDAFQGKERNVLTLVIDALRKPGLYVVVDGGGRFPWYEAQDAAAARREQAAVRPGSARSTTPGTTPGRPRCWPGCTSCWPAPALPRDARPTTSRRTGSATYDDRSDGSARLGIAVGRCSGSSPGGAGAGDRSASRRGCAAAAAAPRREKPFTHPAARRGDALRPSDAAG